MKMNAKEGFWSEADEKTGIMEMENRKMLRTGNIHKEVKEQM